MLRGRALKDKVEPYAKRISGIAHEHRIAIVYLLANGPLIMREIVEALGIPENLVAHHLKQMFTSGWVTKEKKGREVTYTLNERMFLDLPKLFLGTPLEHKFSIKREK